MDRMIRGCDGSEMKRTLFLFTKLDNFVRHLVRSLATMKKLIAVLKSLVLSFFVYMWFLGSSLLIRIESRRSQESRNASLLQQQSTILMGKWENNVADLIGNIQTLCNFNFKKQKITVNDSGSSSVVEKKRNAAAIEALTQARREKAIRDNIIFIPDLKQLWCLVPKAASTSWSHKIIDSIPKVGEKLKSYLRNDTIPVQVVLRKAFGNIGTKKYNEVLGDKNIKRVLLVRHPLSRLVSAFENKLKDRKAKGDSMYFYGHYGVKINRAFRKDRRINKRKEPTFEEFIDYLIQTDPQDYDEHWKPISLLCGLCRINYNHIIKQEDLPHGLEFHLSKLGYNSIGASSGALRSDNKSSKEFKAVQDYFRNITKEKKAQLLRKYEDDFKFFGYEANTI